MNKGRRFAQVPIRAAGDRSLPLSALRVLIAICAHANNGHAWCSLQTISELTGIDIRNLPAAIAALERGGYLRRDGWHHGRTGRSRKYEVIFEDTTSSPDMTSDEAATSCPQMTSHDQETSFPDMTSCADMTSCQDMKEVIPRHEFEAPKLMRTHDQTDQTSKRDQKRDQVCMSIADPIEVEFEEFWALVCKRVDKAEALKLFRQARTKKRIPLATILEAMRSYAKQFAPHGSDDPKYSVGPARWLRGEKWNDEQIAFGDRIVAVNKQQNGGGMIGAVRRMYAQKENEYA